MEKYSVRKNSSMYRGSELMNFKLDFHAFTDWSCRASQQHPSARIYQYDSNRKTQKQVTNTNWVQDQVWDYQTGNRPDTNTSFKLCHLHWEDTLLIVFPHGHLSVDKELSSYISKKLQTLCSENPSIPRPTSHILVLFILLSSFIAPPYNKWVM